MTGLPSFSFICATKGRYSELEILLESLKGQSSPNFELIIVDQNKDDLIKALIERFSNHFVIKHLHLEIASNTKARNIGAQKATADWIGFPDDDCWMPRDFVKDMEATSKPTIDGFFINWTDPTKSPPVKVFRFNEGNLSLQDAFELVSCICIYFKRTRFIEIGGFNGRLGLGDDTIVKAGEEQDLLLRMVSKKMLIKKVPDISIYHKINPRDWNRFFAQRIISQGACDVYFTIRYFGKIQFLRLIGRWIGGVVYNAFLLRKKNFLWYFYKLYGGLVLSHRI